MKKILFAALAALAITSCSQNEEIEAPTQKTEINFRSVVGKSSRAAEATTENLESQGFILYAYNTKTITMDKVTAGSLTTTFINGKKATCTNSNWSVADGPYYWPIAENLQFFAYSPEAGGITNYATTGTYPSFTYTLQTIQTDLLAACVTDKAKTNSATSVGSVDLTFNHILTQINFKLQGKDTGFKYNVTSIKLSGVANSGTYTYNADKGAWSAQTGNEEYTYNATYSEIDGTATSEIATSSNALMLIPQNDLSSVKITVTYSTTNDNGKVFEGTKEATLTGTWDIGKKILYTLTLPAGAEELTFTAQADGWTNEDRQCRGQWRFGTACPYRPHPDWRRRGLLPRQEKRYGIRFGGKRIATLQNAYPRRAFSDQRHFGNDRYRHCQPDLCPPTDALGSRRIGHDE